MTPSVPAFRSPYALAEREENTPVLLAFSGGMDSSVLLRLLYQDAQKRGYPLYLAHVNHGIRGESALADRDFCIAQAKEYGLQIDVLDVDVPALARKHGQSLETEAREVRYAFFAQVMAKRGIPLLATAHHADDHLETLLFRLARGTAGRGLMGIAPVSAFSGGLVTRPLLELSRREIAAYAEEHGIPYVTDATNFDTAYARNALREEVVPVLERLFSHPQARALALSRKLREDEDCLQALAEHFLETQPCEYLHVKDLRALHPAVRRRVLEGFAAERTASPVQEVHLLAMETLVSEGHTGQRIALPGEFFAHLQKGILRIDREEKIPCPSPMPRIAFAPGRIRLESSGIEIDVKNICSDKKIHNLSTTAYINLPSVSAIIDGTLYWRSLAPGDTVYMSGMHRRVRKLFNQYGIPPVWRRALPLLCDEKGILWVPFVGPRDDAPTGEDIRVSVTLPRDIFTISSEKEG